MTAPRCRFVMLLLVACACATGARRPVPEWAQVSTEQRDTAELLGVEVAIEENGVRFVLIPGTREFPAFYLSITEVTNEQYRRFDPTHVGVFLGDRDPVHLVSYSEVVRCLNSWSTTSEYRLPSEAEWEHACRAGASTAYHFGRELAQHHANVGSDVPVAPGGAYCAVAVGSYPPNAWGLYDMHGNVWEFCVAAGQPPIVVARGGGWRHPPRLARADSRWEVSPSHYDPDTGFRVARDVHSCCGSPNEHPDRRALERTRVQQASAESTRVDPIHGQPPSALLEGEQP